MRVPVYERSVGVAPLSMPQVQPLAPVSDNGAAVGKTLEGVFGKLKEIQEGMEDARTLELFNKFKMDSQEYHENPDRGIYNTRLGYRSYGIYKEADEWLRHKGEDYVRELPSERAKSNFRRMAREHIEQRGLQNSRFEADQVKKYEVEQADASIKNSLIYAEQNWNNKGAIEQARRDIQTALELKLRHTGSGSEAFENAYAEYEDQLGAARIRQAFAQHPLAALVMLNHPDIHLKPDTFAKLKKSLTDSTEVYELQAIATAYAQYYTPTNAVEARNKLIERYGADKGAKAYTALTRKWKVDEDQKTAREQKTLEAQKKREEEIIARFNDPNANPPTPQELINLQNSKKIRPQFAMFALSHIKQEQKQAETEAKAQKKAAYDAAYSQFFQDVMLNVNTQEEIDAVRKDLVTLRADDAIERADYNEITSNLDKKERALKEATKAERKARSYDIARDIASRTDLEHVGDVYSEIRKEYGNGEEAKEIIEYFDKLISEQRTARTEEDRAKQERQKQKMSDLLNAYPRQGKMISNSIIQQLEQSGELSPEQVERAYSINRGLDTKAERWAALRQIEGFAELSLAEQEARVMAEMRTTPEKRRANVAYLFQKAVDGTLADSETEHYRAWGMIKDSDAEELKGYEAKFDRAQKNRISAAALQLSNVLREAGADNNIRTVANAEFYMATNNMDLKAKNFNDELTGIYQGILNDAINKAFEGKKLTQFSFLHPIDGVTSKAGERVSAARQSAENFTPPSVNQRLVYTDEQGNPQYMLPSGELQSFDNTIAPVTLPQNRPAPAQEDSIPSFWEAFQVPMYSNVLVPSQPTTQNTGQALSGSKVDTVKSIVGNDSYKVTSEFSAKPTALRHGRGHPALDLRAKVGTPVYVPRFAQGWTVTNTGYNDTAGNFVKLSATIGDNTYEYTYAHLDSIDVAKGDKLNLGDPVAKTGNTGNSTGPHLHISLKVNGKAVDPRSVDIPQVNSQDTAPQPPVLSTKEQQINMLNEIFSISSSNIWSISFSNIWSTSKNYGGLF